MFHLLIQAIIMNIELTISKLNSITLVLFSVKDYESNIDINTNKAKIKMHIDFNAFGRPY